MAALFSSSSARGARGVAIVTVLDLLRISLRRWYILLLGLACIAATCVVLQREEGVYWAQSEVLFLAVDADNPLEDPTEGVIHFASVVQESVDTGPLDLKLSSPSATLHGSGVREGVISTLADAGGQWESNFNRALIRVEAVNSSPERVRSDITRVVDDITTAADQLQSGDAITGSARVLVDSGSGEISVGYMGSTRGSRYRGFALVTLLGGGITLAVAAVVDRRLAARASRRSGAAAR